MVGLYCIQTNPLSWPCSQFAVRVPRGRIVGGWVDEDFDSSVHDSDFAVVAV